MEEELRLCNPAIALRRVRYKALRRRAWRYRLSVIDCARRERVKLRSRSQSVLTVALPGRYRSRPHRARRRYRSWYRPYHARCPRPPPVHSRPSAILPRSQISSGRSTALSVALEPEQLAHHGAESPTARLRALHAHRPDARRKDVGSRVVRRDVRLADVHEVRE